MEEAKFGMNFGQASGLFTTLVSVMIVGCLFLLLEIVGQCLSVNGSALFIALAV